MGFTDFLSPDKKPRQRAERQLAGYKNAWRSFKAALLLSAQDAKTPRTYNVAELAAVVSNLENAFIKPAEEIEDE